MDNKPTSRSERVVVDELYDDGSVCLLRARRREDCADDYDLSINTWQDEREDFRKVVEVEAFMGLMPEQGLREGDVFFIADGDEFDKFEYHEGDRNDVAKLKQARGSRLLQDPAESGQFARKEIKREFFKLAAAHISKEGEDLAELERNVDLKLIQEEIADDLGYLPIGKIEETSRYITEDIVGKMIEQREEAMKPKIMEAINRGDAKRIMDTIMAIRKKGKFEVPG